MIPCKFCLPREASNAHLKGLKQVGKTRTSGTRFERRYRCLDCGGGCIMRGDLALTSGLVPYSTDEWIAPQSMISPQRQ